uniref:Uncharacterized protein n=1 Tax=Canis lupus dingo TaxID=286419 RepID=A0A8C0QWX4_CANLU
MLHLATTDNRTSPECHRPTAKTIKNYFDMNKVDVQDVSREILQSSIPSNNFYLCPGPSAFYISAPGACMGAQANGLLGPLPQLPFALQLSHSLLPLLDSHGMDISKKIEILNAGVQE